MAGQDGEFTRDDDHAIVYIAKHYGAFLAASGVEDVLSVALRARSG